MWKFLEAKENMVIWGKGKKFCTVGVQRVRDQELRDKTGKKKKKPDHEEHYVPNYRV